MASWAVTVAVALGCGRNPCHGKADPLAGDSSHVWKGEKTGYDGKSWGNPQLIHLGQQQHFPTGQFPPLQERRLAQDIS